MSDQILTREQLRAMSPKTVMAAYRAGALDVMTNYGEVTDDLTKDAVELVSSMENAFGVQHTRPVTKEKRAWGGQVVRNVQTGVEPAPPPDLAQKVAETKKALS